MHAYGDTLGRVFGVIPAQPCSHLAVRYPVFLGHIPYLSLPGHFDNLRKAARDNITLLPSTPIFLGNTFGITIKTTFKIHYRQHQPRERTFGIFIARAGGEIFPESFVAVIKLLHFRYHDVVDKRAIDRRFKSPDGILLADPRQCLLSVFFVCRTLILAHYSRHICRHIRLSPRRAGRFGNIIIFRPMPAFFVAEVIFMISGQNFYLFPIDRDPFDDFY